MGRPNIYEGDFAIEREDIGVRGRPLGRRARARSARACMSSHPAPADSTCTFAPVPEGGDEGVVGTFRLEDNLRPPRS